MIWHEIGHHFHQVYIIPHLSQGPSCNFAVNRYHVYPVPWALEMASYHGHSDGQRLSRAR